MGSLDIELIRRSLILANILAMAGVISMRPVKRLFDIALSFILATCLLYNPLFKPLFHDNVLPSIVNYAGTAPIFKKYVWKQPVPGSKYFLQSYESWLFEVRENKPPDDESFRAAEAVSGSETRGWTVEQLHRRAKWTIKSMKRYRSFRESISPFVQKRQTSTKGNNNAETRKKNTRKADWFRLERDILYLLILLLSLICY